MQNRDSELSAVEVSDIGIQIPHQWVPPVMSDIPCVREQEVAVQAEVQAAGLGCTTAIAILNLLRSLVGCDTLRVELLSDNTGCIANHTVTTLRHRHFCVLAAALRDQLNEHSIVLKYRSGKLIVADALSKVLGKNALELARDALGVRCKSSI